MVGDYKTWDECGSKDKTSSNKSKLNDGLCTVSVDLKMKFNWVNPPKDTEEKVQREQKQLMLDKTAHETTEELKVMLRRNGV